MRERRAPALCDGLEVQLGTYQRERLSAVVVDVTAADDLARIGLIEVALRRGTLAALEWPRTQEGTPPSSRSRPRGTTRGNAGIARELELERVERRDRRLRKRLRDSGDTTQHAGTRGNCETSTGRDGLLVTRGRPHSLG